MEHAPLDRTIINLRILGKVPPNARLRTNKNFIEHDQDTLQSYKRWRDREGRVNNRRALRELTDEAIRFSKEHDTEFVVLQQLTDAMELGKRGFITMIETTYNDDDTTKEILNRQLEKLDQQIRYNRTLLNAMPRPRTQPVPIENTALVPRRTSNPSSYKSPSTLSPAQSPTVTTLGTTPKDARVVGSVDQNSHESEESDENDDSDTDDTKPTFNPSELSISM